MYHIVYKATGCPKNLNLTESSSGPEHTGHMTKRN